MPRSGQIIPSWLHPHEAVYINDNTRYEDIAFQNDGPTFLNVFASRKGVDNKLKPFNSVVNWVNEYGLPNYRRYGQPAYNAYVALSTGLATSQSMRVMPADATHANVVVVCKYQKKNGKLQLKFELKAVSNITDADDLQAYVDRMEVVVPDEEGYLALPIMSFWSRGRGIYGNDYRVRISRDKGADKENDYVNYVIELLSTENGTLETLEAYNVSFYNEALDQNSNLTLFATDIIDDEEGKGSKRFTGNVIYDNLVRIFKLYQEVYKEATNPVVTVKEVAELPPTEYPDENDIYIDASDNNSVWVFNTALTVFQTYKSNGEVVKVQDVHSTPVVPPVTLPAAEEFTIINNPSALDVVVFDYAPATGAVKSTANYHEINDVAEVAGTAVIGDIYKVTNSVTPTSPNGYYKAEDASTLAAIDAVEMGVSEVAEGTVFGRENVLYNVSGVYCMVNASGIVDMTANVVPVAKLPSTTLYEAGVVYQLTAEYMGLPVGSKWVYSEDEGTWVIPADPTEPEPMVYGENMENWDIFGYNKFTQAQDPYFAFDGGTESIAILSIEGVPMTQGNDGSFGNVGDTLPNGEVLTSAMRDEAIEQAYLNAFQGAYDKAIASKRRAPVDIMLDANYPLSVKKAMVALAQNRYDAACHLDTNLINNVDDLETFHTQISDLQERLISFDAHMFKTSDPITGKIIPVTITLWLASKYPQHYNVYGNHTPLAGEEYATLSGYQKNSILPVIDADDEETKELMYDKLHMNYVECIAENTYIRGTQQTSQNFWSDLSEENNMLVLLEIKRKIERLAARNRYKWADTEELRLFKQACDEIFSSYIGTKCKSLEIQVDSNDWEKTRYIVHVYLAVVFRTFQKRAIIEIDVNPRA